MVTPWCSDHYSQQDQWQASHVTNSDCAETTTQGNARWQLPGLCQSKADWQQAAQIATTEICFLEATTGENLQFFGTSFARKNSMIVWFNLAWNAERSNPALSSHKNGGVSTVQGARKDRCTPSGTLWKS